MSLRIDFAVCKNYTPSNLVAAPLRTIANRGLRGHFSANFLPQTNHTRTGPGGHASFFGGTTVCFLLASELALLLVLLWALLGTMCCHQYSRTCPTVASRG
ncbi:GCN5 family acetyltransferase [Anopheles sinensis]|uniref:GCN5 family acetyltransferase n=1 Tax=Anopheles sinensis TaxID=74873 RepID=A0A084WMX7_ANOSI|nr:GCN5 family acetyltransferase [Anopheles sinensis]